MQRKKKYCGMATKPTKHKLPNYIPTIAFVQEKFNFRHCKKKQGPAGTRIPNHRVQRQSHYIQAKWEGVCKLQRIDNKQHQFQLQKCKKTCLR